MTTSELIERLQAGDGALDYDTVMEIAVACGVWETGVPAELISWAHVGAWREFCEAIEREALPDWLDGERVIRRNAEEGYVVTLVKHQPRGTGEGRHPTSQCRAHLIAILQARESQP